MDVCLLSCVLSGRGLCNELMTRPEESYRLWCVAVCELGKPRERGSPGPRWAAAKKKIISIYLYLQEPKATSERLINIFANIQSVTGGTDQISGGCSLC